MFNVKHLEQELTKFNTPCVYIDLSTDVLKYVSNRPTRQGAADDPRNTL